MKYFKSSGNHSNDIDRIVGELINIVYGTTFYENGEMLNEPKPKHNTYVIDNVEYEVHPNISLIFLNTDHSSFREVLCGRIGLFEQAVMNKFGMRDIPTGLPGSTQYLLIEDVRTTKNDGRIGYINSDNLIQWNSNLPGGFLHLVYIISKIGAPLNLPIPKISAHKFGTEVNLMSLSTIIYDDSNIFNLPDGDRSPDFPSIEKYNNYQNGKILREIIHWNYYTGLLYDVMHICKFDNLLDTKQVIPNAIKDRTLLWAKWEWLKIYKLTNQVVPWNEQIVKGLLDEEDEDSSLTDESLIEVNKQTKNSERYKCFITGIPIYEDCYAFDVYERTVREFVPTDKVSEYDDAIIISEEMLKKEQDTEKKLKQKAVAAKKAEIAARKAERKRRNRRFQHGFDDSDDEKDDQGDTTVLASQAESKQAESKRTKSTKKKDEKTTTKKESVVKRGTKKQAELVLIERTIKYKTPRCVLISPWFMHFSKELDPVSVFEKATNTKVHLYRTFCPTTLHTLISEFDIDPTYKSVLHDINADIILKGNGILETSTCSFVKEFSTSDVLNTSLNGKIIARLAPKTKLKV